MRNFDERRAEVYRRSAERIKERKRKIKTNIAVIVTPIVLCTFFAGAYFNVVMSPAHENSTPPGDMRGDDGSLDKEIGETLRQPEGEKTDGNDSDAVGETGVPATAPETNGDGKDEAPSSSGIRYVQFEVYAPGTVSVHRDTNEITEVVKLIDEFTNGEATIYGFDGNVVQIPHTTVPKYDFKVVLTTNFGLEWRYAITKSSIIFLANGKSYPINEEQFDLLKETLGIRES